MKRLIYILPLFLILFSCDKIEEGNRSLDVETINTVRPVLLEDFTGQNCTNCPAATRKAATMQKALGENLIVVGIHAGSFSTKKFRTEAGTAYQQELYPSNAGYPAGMIDRTVFEGDLVHMNASKWGTYILDRVQRTDLSLYDMTLIPAYDAVSKSLLIKCTVKALTEAPKVKIQLWLTESHIIDYQRSEDKTIPEYEHNHVLRDAVNGIWGESIDLKVGFETTYTSTYSMEGKEWKKENMHVVAFIYNETSREVLHVVEVPMLNN